MRRLVVLAGLVVALAGCGGGEEATPEPETVEGEVTTQAEPAGEGNAENGKMIFAAQGCGSCHTLAAAGSNGTVGPNLDQSRPSLELAIERITNGMGQMPSFKDELSEEQIRAVAEFVSRSAGR
jgi:cytochrome c6